MIEVDPFQWWLHTIPLIAYPAWLFVSWLIAAYALNRRSPGKMLDNVTVGMFIAAGSTMVFVLLPVVLVVAAIAGSLTGFGSLIYWIIKTPRQRRIQ